MEQPKTCECGCGHPIRDGSAARFLRGHNLRVCPPPWFKGEAAGYRAVHTWINKHFPKCQVCAVCGGEGATDYALIHGQTYSRRREDYIELCRRCHVMYDGTGGSRWRGRTTRANPPKGEQPPACGCCCGEKVSWSRKHGRWNRFAAGHYTGDARRAVQRGGGAAP